MIIKRTITEGDVSRDIFVEEITDTREIVWTKDSIESQITQKQNTIDNIENEIAVLQGKLDEINAL